MSEESSTLTWLSVDNILLQHSIVHSYSSDLCLLYTLRYENKATTQAASKDQERCASRTKRVRCRHKIEKKKKKCKNAF